jgi:hypothetical protein
VSLEGRVNVQDCVVYGNSGGIPYQFVQGDPFGHRVIQRSISFFAFPQRALRQDSLGNIASDSVKADQFTLFIGDRILSIVDPATPAILAPGFLDAIGYGCAGKDLLFQAVIFVCELLGKDIIVCLTQQVGPMLGRITQGHQGLARPGKDVVAILEVDVVIRVLHHGSEIERCRRIVERAWQTLCVRQQQLKNDPSRVGQGLVVFALDTANATIRLPDADIQRPARRLPSTAKPNLGNVLIMRMNALNERYRASQEILRTETEQFHNAIADR